jgi:pyrimidine nucleoside transport protein
MAINSPLSAIPWDATGHASLLDERVFANNRGLGLLCLTLLVAALYLWDKHLAAPVTRQILSAQQKLTFISSNSFVHKWLLKTVLSALCILYVLFNMEGIQNLISLCGMFTLVLTCVLISKHPAKINWSVLVSGILMQFILCLVVLRIEFGYKLLKFLTKLVTSFLEFTDTGSMLVFGNSYSDHFFAFKALPVIVFFSAMISLFYHVGLVQYVIFKLAWVVNKLVGTSPTESINSAANIFLGQSEAPLLIRPLMPKMTDSEIFAVLVGGFATAAGSVLAAYIGFGVPANHVIIASIMAAPGALYVSKTIFPETEESEADWNQLQNLPKGFVIR